MGAPKSHAGDTLGPDEGAPALPYRHPRGGDADRAPGGHQPWVSSKHDMRDTGPRGLPPPVARNIGGWANALPPDSTLRHLS